MQYEMNFKQLSGLVRKDEKFQNVRMQEEMKNPHADGGHTNKALLQKKHLFWEFITRAISPFFLLFLKQMY